MESINSAPEYPRNMEELESLIGYRFSDPMLLKTALTHSSYAHEAKSRLHKDVEYNERLEFLGDSVLSIIVSKYLFVHFKNYPEGELTKLRAGVVSEKSLGDIASEIRLGDFLYLGRGEEANGGRQRISILADAFEALLGAIFLDGGFEKAREFIHRFILSDLENKQLFFDSKCNLQEYVARNIKKELEYITEEELGEGNEKIFRSKVMIGGEFTAEGSGRSKKASQQEAAYNALLKIRSTDVS